MAARSTEKAGESPRVDDGTSAIPLPDDADQADVEGVGEELVIALVYPVGTDGGLVAETINEALADVAYTASDPPIHLIEELEATTYGREALDGIRKKNEELFSEAPSYFRDYWDRMDLGNAFRQKVGGLFPNHPRAGAGAMGMLAAGCILANRPTGADPGTIQRHAYVIRSLKVPEEIIRLRQIYGDALIVVGVHSEEEARRRTLTSKISASARRAGLDDDFRSYADQLMARDQMEGTAGWGQQVSEAFPLADVFLDATHSQRLEASVKRLIAILFRYRFHTPTKTEYGMFHAYGAALRSADLSRQVGAAIVDDDGEIIALGTNEVPKGGGGQYWPDDPRDDGRDFALRRDISFERKQRALNQFLRTLAEKNHLANPDLTAKDIWDLLQGTDFMNVTEYGRATHAEMAALSHSARRGVSVEGATVYTTTFPCHVCARHIVQAGIARVVYNEPYPKSLTRELHGDSVSVGTAAEDHVLFEAFVGISPALYADAFRVPRASRRTKDGRIRIWQRRRARPIRSADPRSYLAKEIEIAVHLKRAEAMPVRKE